jgi:hypothetical protein
VAVALLATGCDLGTQEKDPSFASGSGAGAPIHLVAQNVGPSEGLAPNGVIELFFDRLLLADSVTRQSFPIVDLNGNLVDNPGVFYDPVARSVTLTPTQPFQACQTFRVYIETPSDAGPGGLLTIDGATLDPSTPEFIEFPVLGTCATGGDAGPDAAAPATGTVTTFPAIDFCGSIFPIFASKCTGTTCHGGDLPAAGLRLDSSQGIVDTAINRVSIEANTGPRAAAQPPSNTFALDMPLIARNGTGNSGDPGDSWLLYKLLLAPPPACSSTPGAGPCDAGSPTVQHDYHSKPWTGITDAERAVLGSTMVGREMPFPLDPSAIPGAAAEPLTLDELDTVSLWIAQGAPVPACP